MKTLFASEAISKSGRTETIQARDGLRNVTSGSSSEKPAPNPEQSFPDAYSDSYHSALVNAARKLGTSVKDSTVRARVSLIENDRGSKRLAVEMHAQLPGIDRAQVQRIMAEAHKTCPYTQALPGDTSFELVVD